MKYVVITSCPSVYHIHGHGCVCFVVCILIFRFIKQVYELPSSWKHLKNIIMLLILSLLLSWMFFSERIQTLCFSRSHTGLFSMITLLVLSIVPAWLQRQSGLVTLSSCLTSRHVISLTLRWVVATLWLWHMLFGIILALDSFLSFPSRCNDIWWFVFNFTCMLCNSKAILQQICRELHQNPLNKSQVLFQLPFSPSMTLISCKIQSSHLQCKCLSWLPFKIFLISFMLVFVHLNFFKNADCGIVIRC